MGRSIQRFPVIPLLLSPSFAITSYGLTARTVYECVVRTKEVSGSFNLFGSRPPSLFPFERA